MEEVKEGQIEIWKKQHKEVFLIEVPIEAGGEEMAKGYFKKPDLDVIGASAKFADKDPIKAGLVVFNNCWLGGDAVIKSDDELKLGVIKELGQLFKPRIASLKKL